MRVSDRIYLENIDGRELQLMLLASLAIIVLATGLALLMYPAVFSHDFLLSGQTLQIAFIGFCVLSLLLVTYLLDRQLTIRRLRRQLAEERRRNIELRRQASADLLNALPGLSSFHERMATESRGGAGMQRTFSVLVIKLNPSYNLADEGEIASVYGDAAKAICRKLRAEDTVYLFSPGYYGILLPNMSMPNAQGLTQRLTEGLQDAAGVNGRFTADIRIFNYPEHAQSIRQLEQAVCSLLPEILSASVAADTRSS